MSHAHGLSKQTRLFLLGGLLGIIAFLIIFGFSSLDVTNDFFLRGGFVEKDTQQHYAGWLYYRQAAWQFPLGIAQGINCPDGISIAYTDSIPLFAVLCKALSPLLPDTFQYFGWFSLICYFLMGGFSALLVCLFVDSTPAAVLGTAPFVFSPVLVERTLHHTSLGAQFFLIAALYYYFRSRREKQYFYPVLFLLNGLLLSIHPYFVPICYAVTFALLGQYALEEKQFVKPALLLAGNLGLTVAVGWLFGLFYTSSSGGSDYLYGYFGMNLNALWNPTSIGDTCWSLFLPIRNQVGGNYDAFSYLGLGILVSLVPAGILAGKSFKRTVSFIRENLILLLCCLALTVFAVSHVVTANGATLMVLPLPEKLIQLASIFRSSGRMFWPCYYLLFLWSVVTLSRLKPSPSLWLAFLVLFQLTDLSPAILSRHSRLAFYGMQEPYSGEYPTTLTDPFWSDSAGQYKHLFSLGGDNADSLHLALYTADNGMTTNDPFAARYDAESLASYREETLKRLCAGQADPDTLYFTSDEGIFLTVAPAMKDSAYCAKLAEHQYIIAPGYKGGSAEAIPYGDRYPVRIADYTDGNWDAGVLDWDDCTILFTDCDLTRHFLENAAAISANGHSYPILEVSDKDAGWLMVTLDISDARILQNVILEAVK